MLVLLVAILPMFYYVRGDFTGTRIVKVRSPGGTTEIWRRPDP